VDEVFLFHGTVKRYLYRAVDKHGQVVDVLLRDRRDIVSAESFFGQAIARSGKVPASVVSDHHQPYVKAVQRAAGSAQHIRTGLHRRRGETTKPIERSHVAVRDRLRSSRGLKSRPTGQRLMEGFEVMHAMRRDHILLRRLVPSYRPTRATAHQRVRAVVAAMNVLALALTKTT